MPPWSELPGHPCPAWRGLTPVGESYRQALTLTQLCLEEAPADLLPQHAPTQGWCWPPPPAGPRWRHGLGLPAHLKGPAYQAQELRLGRHAEGIDALVGLLAREQAELPGLGRQGGANNQRGQDDVSHGELQKGIGW
ncbi:MAG: hypothetical protein IPI84_05195 [Holophagaceae bacterium]|nr:hypothetical protein [Holophagaceae bacterium]